MQTYVYISTYVIDCIDYFLPCCMVWMNINTLFQLANKITLYNRFFQKATFALILNVFYLCTHVTLHVH